MDGDEAVVEGAQPVGDTGAPVENAPAQEQPELSEHAQRFLSNIPDEAERVIMAKHLPVWDGGFTRYANSQREKYRPYEELGDVETLRKAKGVFEQLSTDPAGVIDFFFQNREAFGLDWKWQIEQAIAAEQAAQESQIPDYLKPIQDQVSKLPTFEKALTQIAAKLQQQEEAERKAKEDAELETALKALKMQHGDFDVEFVLNKAERNGYDLEGAVKEYKLLEQRLLTQAAAKPPSNILSGSSQPQPSKSPAEMSTQERKAALLASLQGLQS